jgi:hypothetical protein
MDGSTPSVSLHARLKALREQANMSIRATASALGSNYAYYESRTFKGPFLPMRIARRLAEIWAPHGVDSGDVLALAGSFDELPTVPTGLRAPEAQRFAVEDDSDRALVAALAPEARRADLWQVNSRALDLAGVLPGDFLVVDIGDVDARKGDIVCAQVHSRTGDHAQTVFRIYEKPYLVALSSERRYAKPLQVDDSDVTIMGRVLASFRRHR